jgi:hypothetical protein
VTTLKENPDEIEGSHAPMYDAVSTTTGTNYITLVGEYSISENLTARLIRSSTYLFLSITDTNLA